MMAEFEPSGSPMHVIPLDQIPKYIGRHIHLLYAGKEWRFLLLEVRGEVVKLETVPPSKSKKKKQRQFWFAACQVCYTYKQYQLAKKEK